MSTFEISWREVGGDLLIYAICVNVFFVFGIGKVGGGDVGKS